MTACLFANIQISNAIRFEYFKKSFLSFSNVSFDKWYVNVRGLFKKEAKAFLTSQLGANLMLFDLDSGNWHRDSQKMFSNVVENTIFYWIEDHILQLKPMDFDKLIADFLESNCDYLQYSFLGLNSHFEEFSEIKNRVSCKYFDVINYGLSENALRQKAALRMYGKNAYLVALCSICSYEFFRSNLFNKRFLPLRRWPKKTPFDFERSSEDLWVLPFKVAVPKLEIFCSIDDDGPVKGSSLQSRGLIKREMPREDLLKLEGRGVHKSVLKVYLKRIPILYPIAKPIIRFLKRISFYF